MYGASEYQILSAAVKARLSIHAICRQIMDGQVNLASEYERIKCARMLADVAAGLTAASRALMCGINDTPEP